jgi:hypothetical protein
MQAEYGSIARFCKAVGRSKEDTYKFFTQCLQKMTTEREQELIVLQDEVDRFALVNAWIDDELKWRVRMALRRYGGMRKFCNDHEQFPYHFVSMVINRNKRRTDKVNEFLKVIGID